MSRFAFHTKSFWRRSSVSNTRQWCISRFRSANFAMLVLFANSHVSVFMSPSIGHEKTITMSRERRICFGMDT